MACIFRWGPAKFLHVAVCNKRALTTFCPPVRICQRCVGTGDLYSGEGQRRAGDYLRSKTLQRRTGVGTSYSTRKESLPALLLWLRDYYSSRARRKSAFGSSLFRSLLSTGAWVRLCGLITIQEQWRPVLLWKDSTHRLAACGKSKRRADTQVSTIRNFRKWSRRWSRLR